MYCTKSKKSLVLYALSTVLCACVLHAGAVSMQEGRLVPKLLNYQGYLTDTLGVPVTNPSLAMTFRIYDASSSGMLLWNENQNVSVNKGIFNAVLGIITPVPDSIFIKYTYPWLEISVMGQVLLPRTRIVSSAYSYTSTYSDTASYARNSAPDNDWWFRITDGADTTLQMHGAWGLARAGNVMNGNADSTHVNLGVSCFTGHPGHDFKYCTVGGGLLNQARGHHATVGGGYWNTAGGEDGVYATVSGGEYNTASNNFSTVGGGGSNTADAENATVGGGIDNTAGGYASTVGGGIQNFASDVHATVGGGSSNTAFGYIATVAGGDHNNAFGYISTVGGGYYNTANGGHTTVSGGSGNSADGDYATVGGGDNNSASGLCAVAGGGYHNSASGDYSVIIGGYADSITSTGDYSYLFGINSNLTQDSTFMVDMPHIWFGDESSGYEFPTTDGVPNQVLVTDGSGQLSWTGMAYDNDWVISGSDMYSAVTGNVGIGTTSPMEKLQVDNGNIKIGTADCGVIFYGGGEKIIGISGWGIDFQTESGTSRMTILNNGNIGVHTTTPQVTFDVNGVICGGTEDTVKAAYGAVLGGYSNLAGDVADDTASVVAGGWNNSARQDYSFVGGGQDNTANGDYSTVGGGYNSGAVAYSFVGGGETNYASGSHTTVGGGIGNTASAQYATVSGGYYNIADVFGATVAGGCQNVSSGWHSTVGGGYAHTVDGFWGGILSGWSNTAGDAYDDTAVTVVGGRDNSATTKYAFVGGGRGNVASGNYAVVVGGHENTAIGYGVIVGCGYHNYASGNHATVGGGYDNTASGNYATVAGGYADTASATYSFATNNNSNALHDNSAAFNGQATTASGQTRVGALSKASGTFTIDHPLDPENKILNHYFVESPEMVLIYRGIATIGGDGRCEVHLPDYYDALNEKPQIQLTGVGTYEVYIAQNVMHNSFVIGGKPGAEVHWTVTGARKDPSAEITKIIMPVEQPKDGQLAGRSLDDDFLCVTMQQLERMGKAGQFQFRTAAARQRYEEMQKTEVKKY